MRNYDSEYKNYQGTLIQKKRRALRNKARRMLIRVGLVKKGDNKDVDHTKPLVKGGGIERSNLRPLRRSDNRSFNRTRTARMR